MPRLRADARGRGPAAAATASPFHTQAASPRAPRGTGPRPRMVPGPRTAPRPPTAPPRTGMRSSSPTPSSIRCPPGLPDRRRTRRRAEPAGRGPGPSRRPRSRPCRARGRVAAEVARRSRSSPSQSSPSPRSPRSLRPNRRARRRARSPRPQRRAGRRAVEPRRRTTLRLPPAIAAALIEPEWIARHRRRRSPPTRCRARVAASAVAGGARVGGRRRARVEGSKPTPVVESRCPSPLPSRWSSAAPEIRSSRSVVTEPETVRRAGHRAGDRRRARPPGSSRPEPMLDRRSSPRTRRTRPARSLPRPPPERPSCSPPCGQDRPSTRRSPKTSRPASPSRSPSRPRADVAAEPEPVVAAEPEPVVVEPEPEPVVAAEPEPVVAAEPEPTSAPVVAAPEPAPAPAAAGRETVRPPRRSKLRKSR